MTKLPNDTVLRLAQKHRDSEAKITAGHFFMFSIEDIEGMMEEASALIQAELEKTARAVPQTIIDPASSTFVKSVLKFLEAVDWNQDNKDSPQKYAVPYGPLNEMRAALTGLGNDKRE